MTIVFRFHFAKALFSKIKNKYRLGHVFGKGANSAQRKLAFILRQYLSLPLLRSDHMKQQLERLEQELRKLCPDLSDQEARNANLFHNYVISYWFRLHGTDAISVFGADATTNNRMER